MRLMPAGLQIASALAIVLLLVPTRGGCQLLFQDSASKSDLTEKVQAGELDWGKEFYYATGDGAVPRPDEEPNRARAYLKAKGFGKMMAIANLLMAVEGTAISYKAVGKDYLTKDPELRQTVDGYVSNVEIVGEKQQAQGEDTIVSVTVRAPMYGAKGVGSAILKSKFQHEKVIGGIPGDLVFDKKSDARAATIASEAGGTFTSLIVDCTGLGVERAMSPKLRRSDGSEVWGTVSVDYDFLQDHGIVAYTRTVDEARRNARAGSNPLLVRATGRAGNRFMCDPTTSDADADRLIRENQTSHFLDKFDVIFAVDAR